EMHSRRRTTLDPYTTLFRSEPIDDRRDETTGPAPWGPAVHKYQRVFGNERVEAGVVYFYGRVRRISHNDLRSTSLPVRYMPDSRSEEHTSELQSRGHLVCRL